MEATMGNYSEDIRRLEGKEIILNEKIIKIKVLGLFDLSALNCLLGKLSKKGQIWFFSSVSSYR